MKSPDEDVLWNLNLQRRPVEIDRADLLELELAITVEASMGEKLKC